MSKFAALSTALVATAVAEKAALKAQAEAERKAREDAKKGKEGLPGKGTVPVKVEAAVAKPEGLTAQDGALFRAVADCDQDPSLLGSKWAETKSGLAALKAKAEAERKAREDAAEAKFMNLAQPMLALSLRTLGAEDILGKREEELGIAQREFQFVKNELETAEKIMVDEKISAIKRIERLGGEAGLARLARLEESLPQKQAKLDEAKRAIQHARAVLNGYMGEWAKALTDSRMYASVVKNVNAIEAKARALKTPELCAQVSAWTFCLSFMTKDEKKAEAIRAGAKRWLKAAAGEGVPLTRDEMAAKQAAWEAEQKRRQLEQEARVNNVGKVTLVGKGTHSGPATEAMGTIAPKSEAAKKRIAEVLAKQAESKAANAALRAGKDVATAKGFIPKGRIESAPQGKGKGGKKGK